MDIRKYLDDLEGRIDPAVEDALLDEWKAFCDGGFRGTVFTPRRRGKRPAGIEWPDVGVNPALGDFTLMALQQFRECSISLAGGDGSLLNVRCNYGTGIMPSLFGAEPFVMDEALNTLPTNRPIGSDEATLRRLLDRGVPDPESGLGANVFEMAGIFTAVAEDYPKIGKYVRIYHPDLQGPMDVCELMYGSDIFVDLLEKPGLIREMLELVTATYVAFMGKWMKAVPSKGTHGIHWSMMHKGTVMIRDDSAMNLPPAMFEEFIMPFDQRVLDEFGGGAIHFCGRGDHFIHKAAGMGGLFAVNLTQPELNDMEKVFRSTVERGIKLIGLDRPAAEKALAAGRNLHGSVHCW